MTDEPDAPGPPVAELTYTDASHELDRIVAFFEQREVDVDRLVDQLERATAIVDELDRRLRRTRAQVEQLVPRLEAAVGARSVEDVDGGGHGDPEANEWGEIAGGDADGSEATGEPGTAPGLF